MARGIVCALAGGVCWGFSGTCAQLLMNDYGAPAEWITCVRMVIAAAFFLFLTAVRDWRDLVAVFRDRRSLVQIALFAVFGVLLTQMSYLNAIRYTSAGVGTAIEQIGLVLIMLYVCVRARRLPRVREALGLACALGGMLLIATQGEVDQLAIPPEGLGWGLVSAVALAFYTLMPVHVLKKWGAMLVTGLAMLFGGTAASAVVQPWAVPVQLTGGALAGQTATEEIMASQAARLEITKALSPAVVAENGQLTYTFTIRNFGPTAVDAADDAAATRCPS